MNSDWNSFLPTALINSQNLSGNKHEDKSWNKFRQRENSLRQAVRKIGPVFMVKR